MAVSRSGRPVDVHLGPDGTPLGITGRDRLMWIVISAHRRAGLPGGWVCDAEGPLPGQPLNHGRQSLLVTPDGDGWWLERDHIADPADEPY